MPNQWVERTATATVFAKALGVGRSVTLAAGAPNAPSLSVRLHGNVFCPVAVSHPGRFGKTGHPHTTMSERRIDDAEVQRVVRHFSQEPTIREVTKNWSAADFLYGLERVEIDTPGLQRDHFRFLFRKLRDEREASDARATDEEASQRRHTEAMDLARQSLRKSDTANTIAKWAIFLALVALTVSVVQTFWR